MSETVRDVDTAGFEQAVRAQKVALVDFWAPWCGPCRMVSPHVEAVAEKMGAEAAFLKVNVDDNPALSQRFGVMSIPTLIIFRDGAEVARMVGARGRAEIERAVREWLS